jgi:hypothetical protein
LKPRAEDACDAINAERLDRLLTMNGKRESKSVRSAKRSAIHACDVFAGKATLTAVCRQHQRATGFSVSGENHLSDDTASRKVLDERGRWDIININTPFVRDVLYPAGAIRALSPRFADRLNNLAAHFQSLQSGGAQFR